jgi:hypothetical protein
VERGLGHFRHLGARLSRRHDLEVWRRAEQPLDRETVDGIIRMLMEINAKLDLLLAEDDDGDGEDES